jgi:hypothetical protein
VLHRYHKLCGRLRDCVDLDMVDESLIHDGVLDHYRALVILPIGDAPADVQQAIDRACRSKPELRVIEADARDLITSVATPLRDHVWGDWREDGIFHARTDTGVFILNTHAERRVDTMAGRQITLEPHGLALVPGNGEEGKSNR